jgi:hypothetical protein
LNMVLNTVTAVEGLERGKKLSKLDLACDV